MTSPRCLETMDTVVVEDTQVMEMPSAAQWAAVLYMKSVLFVPACQPKLFYLPAAHWAAASTFSIHFHIVEKNLETLISTNHANFQRQISQKKLEKLISYLHQFIRKKQAIKKKPKTKFYKLTYK